MGVVGGKGINSMYGKGDTVAHIHIHSSTHVYTDVLAHFMGLAEGLYEVRSLIVILVLSGASNTVCYGNNTLHE